MNRKIILNYKILYNKKMSNINLRPLQENENQIEHNSNMPTDTIKFRRKLSRINTRMRKVIQRIEDTIPKKIGSIYDGKSVKVRVMKNIGLADRINKNNLTEEKEAYNVFSNEDDKIKDLMNKFKEKNAKDKIPKLTRKKMVFNRLYNITDNSIKQLKDIKKKKRLYSLEKYQENILKSVNVNSVDQSEIMKLVQNFNDIKIESYNVKALPPININIIKDHVYRKKQIESRRKSFMNYMVKKEPLDEFEKEQRLIKKLKSYKPLIKRRRNKNLDVLPQYVRDIFTKSGY